MTVSEVVATEKNHPPRGENIFLSLNIPHWNLWKLCFRETLKIQLNFCVCRSVMDPGCCNCLPHCFNEQQADQVVR